MDLSFRRSGFVPILAIDDNKAAVDTYNWNHAEQVAVRADIRELSATGIVELLNRISPGLAPRGVIGGPPCQSFSVGNVAKKARDPRAQLGQEYARVLKALNETFQLDFFRFRERARPEGTQAQASLQLDLPLAGASRFYVIRARVGCLSLRRASETAQAIYRRGQ